MIHHGSPNRITHPFRSLSHFGTRLAAIERLISLGRDYSSDGYGRKEGWLHTVELDIQNPLIINDSFYLSHTPLRLIDMLYYDLRVISQHERHIILKAGTITTSLLPSSICSILRKKGYDGMKYRNINEDRGSISYVIYDSNQAKTTNVERVWFNV